MTEEQLLDQRTWNERNDCTVIALAVAADMPYREAWRILAEQGRKQRQGMHFHIYMRNLLRTGEPVIFNGFQVYRHPIWWEPFPLTIGEFLRDNKQGRFIVQVKGHVLPVIDGQRLRSDPASIFEPVLTAWEFVRIP